MVMSTVGGWKRNGMEWRGGGREELVERERAFVV
jgi:hypothetical protein